MDTKTEKESHLTVQDLFNKLKILLATNPDAANWPIYHEEFGKLTPTRIFDVWKEEEIVILRDTSF